MTRSFDFLIVAVLISLSSSITLKNKNSSKVNQIPIPVPSFIHITVDNTLVEIKVNGEKVDLFAPNAGKWEIADTFMIPYFAGDKIEIKGRNISGPAAMIATIEYTKLGTPARQFLSTNVDEWECTGGIQGFGKLGEGVWDDRVSGAEDIASDAEWIWGVGQEVVCSFPIEDDC